MKSTRSSEFEVWNGSYGKVITEADNFKELITLLLSADVKFVLLQSADV